MSYTEDDTFKKLKRITFDEMIKKTDQRPGFLLNYAWPKNQREFVEQFGWTEIELKEYESNQDYRIDRDNGPLLAHIAELKAKE